jgi:hypothetical protein
VSTIQPTLFIGIGHRGRQVLQNLKHQILSSHGALPALRWLALDMQYTAATTVTPPSTDRDPNTLDAEETFSIPWQEPGTPCASRAGSRQALRARADELADLVRQALPELTSFEAIAATRAAGFQVADSHQVALYVVADLGDPVGGSMLGQVTHLIGQICRQQGREPRCAGVFFLPDSTRAEPAAEANAYAALKELDAHLADPSLWQNGRPDSRSSTLPFAHETQSLFNRGCYLLDTVNEQAYTVPIQVLIEQAARWLYSMSVLALYRIVDDTFDERFARRSIRRKIRAYGSFGLAGHTLPAGAFREWCAARLGQTIIRQGLLHEGNERLPAGAAEDFVSRNGLRAPDLTALLRTAIVTAVSENSVQHLRTGRLQELDDRLRGALRQVREVDLPLQQQQVQEQTTALSRQIGDSLAQKLLALMRQSSADAIAITREFLNRLDAQVIGQAEALAQQEKQYSAHRYRVIAQASRLSYQLKAVLMRLPPPPVLALTALGGLVLPIACWLAVTFAAAKSQSSEAVWLIWPLLLGGAGSVVAYHLWTARLQDRKQRAAYVEHLHARAELELTPLLAHAASVLYQQVRTTIAKLNDGLDRLAGHLTEAAENMAALEQRAAETLADQARPGPWQSLLTPSLAEQLYRPNVGDLATHLPAIVETLGLPDTWAACSPDVLTSQFLAYARDHLQGVRSLSIQDVLRQQASTLEDRSEWLAGLLHRATPQCAFSDDVSSQSRVPSRVAHVLILDEPPDAELSTHFTALSPDAHVLNAGNAQTVTVVSMRWGLPAFALRRLNQYWAAYAAALQQSDASMHASPKELLLPEPIPTQAGLPDRAALFAVALGMGLIHRDIAGPFWAKDPSGQLVSLGDRKETAAVLLGQWSGGARTLHRAVRAAIASLGKRAATDRLQHYLRSTSDLTAWEQQAIQQFIADLT